MGGAYHVNMRGFKKKDVFIIVDKLKRVTSQMYSALHSSIQAVDSAISPHNSFRASTNFTPVVKIVRSTDISNQKH